MVAALGLAPRLVAHNVEDYVEKAVAFRTTEHRRAVSSALQDAVTDFSLRRYSQHWLKGLQLAWQRHTLSLAPAHIQVPLDD